MIKKIAVTILLVSMTMMLTMMGTIIVGHGAAEIILMLGQDHHYPPLVELSGTNASIFKYLENDGNVTKSSELIIQSLGNPVGLPNSTYQWYLAEPAPL